MGALSCTQFKVLPNNILEYESGNTSCDMRGIRIITKLPNSEQSYKRKVKTHKYINRQNQSTTAS